MSILKVSSNYANSYDKARDVVSKNQFYTDTAWAKHAQEGDLPMYIKTLSDSFNIKDIEGFKNQYGLTDHSSDETNYRALINELYADKTKTSKRQLYAYNDDGTIKKDLLGNPLYNEQEMTDYEYYKQMIKDQVAYEDYEYLLDLKRKEKEAQNWLVKTSNTIGGAILDFGDAFVKTFQSIASAAGVAADFTGGLLNDAANKVLGFETDNKNIEQRLKESIDTASIDTKELKDIGNWIDEFESRYSYIRDVDGNLTNFGKYVDGFTQSTAQMVAAMLTGRGISKPLGMLTEKFSGIYSYMSKGEKLLFNTTNTIAKNSASIVFYTAVTSDNVRDTYKELSNTQSPPSATAVLGNAIAKSAAQYAIEVVLGKVLGGSFMDKMIYGRDIKNVATTSASYTTKNLTIEALKRIGKDIVEEGLEEVFQDTSDALLNVIFDKLNLGNFGALNEGFGIESLIDSFIMGALNSFILTGYGIAKNTINNAKLGTTPVTVKSKLENNDIQFKKMNPLAAWQYGLSVESLKENQEKFEKQLTEILRENGIDTTLFDISKALTTNLDEKTQKKIQEAQDRLQQAKDNRTNYEKMTDKQTVSMIREQASIKGMQINTLEGLLTLISDKNIKIDNKTRKELSTSLKQIYGSYKLLTSYLGEIGEQRANEANKILERFDNAISEKQPNVEEIIKSYHELDVNIDKRYSADILKARIDYALETVSKEQVKEVEKELKNEIKKDTKIKKEQAKNSERKASPVAEQNTQEVLNTTETLDNVVITKEGDNVVRANYNTIIVPEKLAELGSDEILDDLAEQDINNIIEDIISDDFDKTKTDIISKFVKVISDVKDNKIFTEFKSMLNIAIYRAKKLYNITNDTDAYQYIFYNQEFLRSLMQEVGDKRIEGFLEVLYKISTFVKNYSTDDHYRIAFNKQIELIKNNIKTCLLDYVKYNPYAYIPNNIFNNKELLEIKNTRYTELIYYKISNLADGFNQLTTEEQTILKNKIYNTPVSNTEKTNMLNILQTGPIVERIKVLNKLDEMYYNAFTGKYNDKIYMKETTYANRIFNQFLMQNNLTLANLFDKSEDISEEEHLVNITRQFEIYTNNQYSFVKELNGNLYIFSTDEKSNTIYNKEQMNAYNKLLNDIYKNGSKNATSITNISNISLSKLNILDNSVSKDMQKLLSIDDVILNTNLLSDKIKEQIVLKYGKLNSLNTYFFLKSYILNTTKGTVSVVIGANSNFVLVNVTPMIKIFKKDITIKNNMSLKEILDNKYIAKSNRVSNCIIVFNSTDFKNGEEAYYNHDKNIIVINKALLNNTEKVKFNIAHELQHLLQRDLALNTGFNTRILNTIDNKTKKTLTKDVMENVPSLFVDKTGKLLKYPSNNKKVNAYIESKVNELIYYCTGEYEANGLVLNDQLAFYPFVTTKVGNVTYLNTPWGTQYELSATETKNYFNKGETKLTLENSESSDETGIYMFELYLSEKGLNLQTFMQLDKFVGPRYTALITKLKSQHPNLKTGQILMFIRRMEFKKSIENYNNSVPETDRVPNYTLRYNPQSDNFSVIIDDGKKDLNAPDYDFVNTENMSPISYPTQLGPSGDTDTTKIVDDTALTDKNEVKVDTDVNKIKEKQSITQFLASDNNTKYINTEDVENYPALEAFKGQHLSKSMVNIIIHSSDKNIDDNIANKIKKGYLETNDLKNFITDVVTHYDTLSKENQAKARETYTLFNEYYFENNDIKSLDDLIKLTDMFKNYYNIFDILNSTKITFEDNKTNKDILEEKIEKPKDLQDLVAKIVSTEKGAKALRKKGGLDAEGKLNKNFKSEDTKSDVATGAIGINLLNKYDGTIKSLLKIYRAFQIAKKYGWNITGDVKQISTSYIEEKRGNPLAEESREDYYTDFYVKGLLLDASTKERINAAIDIYMYKYLSSYYNKVKKGEIKNTIENYNKFINKLHEIFINKYFDIYFYNKNNQGLYKIREDLRQLKIVDLNSAYEKSHTILTNIRTDLNKTIIGDNSKYIIDGYTLKKTASNEVVAKINQLVNGKRSGINYDIKHNKYTVDDVLKKYGTLFEADGKGGVKLKDTTTKLEENMTGGKNKKYRPINELIKVHDTILKMREDLRMVKDAMAQKIKELEKALKESNKKLTSITKQLINGKLEVTYEIDGSIVGTANVELPENIKDIYDKDYTKSVKSLSKHFSEPDSKHIRIQTCVRNFIKDNESKLASLTQEDAVQFVKFVKNFGVNAYISDEQFRKFYSTTMMLAAYMHKNKGTFGAIDLTNVVIDGESATKILESFLERFAGLSGFFRNAVGMLNKYMNPAIAYQAMAKRLGIEFDTEILNDMAKAIASKDITKVHELRTKLYNDALEKNKTKSATMLDKLYSFERAAMMSSPHAWVRNYATNVILTWANAKVDKLTSNDKIMNKISQFVTGQHNKINDLFNRFRPTAKEGNVAHKFGVDSKQFKITNVTPTTEAENFYNEFFVENGLESLINSGISNRFDTNKFITELTEEEKLEGKQQDTLKNAVTPADFIQLAIADSVAQQVGFNQSSDATFIITGDRRKQLEQKQLFLLAQGQGNSFTASDYNEYKELREKLKKYDSDKTYRDYKRETEAKIERLKQTENLSEDEQNKLIKETEKKYAQIEKDRERFKQLEDKAIQGMTEEQARTYKYNKLALTLTNWGPAYNFVFKMISDASFVSKKTKYYFTRMLTEAKVDLSEGLTNEVLNLYVKAYVQASQDYMHKHNFWNTIETNIRSKYGNAAYYGFKQLFPYASSSWNWFVERTKWTPIGLVSALHKLATYDGYMQKLEERRSNQREAVPRGLEEFNLRRDIGKGTVGSVATLIGLLLAAIGGAEEDSEDDKFKIKLGEGVYFDPSEIEMSSGLILGIGLVSSFKKAHKNEDWFSALSASFYRMCREIFIDDTVTNFTATLRSFDKGSGNQKLATVIDNQLSYFVPSGLRYLSNILNLRNVNYGIGAQRVWNKMIGKNTIIGNWLQDAYIDPYTGEVQYKYAGGALGSFAMNLLNKTSPIKFSVYDISKYEREALAHGVHKEPLTGQYNINNERYYLSVKEQSILNRYYGTLNNKELNQLFNNKKVYEVLDKATKTYKRKTYSNMTDDEKSTVIDRIMSNNSTYAKIYVLTNYDKYKYYCSESERDTLRKLGITKNIYVANEKNKGFKKIS